MPQAMMIMTAVQAVSSYAAGQQQAAAAASAANAQSRAAWENYNIQKNQLEQEAIQTSNQAMMEQSERAKQLMIEQAKITTMTGESGVSGSSVNALLQDSYMQAGVDLTTIETNRLMRGMQNQSQVRSSYAIAKNRNTEANMAAQQAYDRAPSLLGTALQIGMAGADYIDKYGSLTSTTKIK